jgi:aspartyl-tRNA(Asn)/glutamyl-tRNA(Gln) amidotransferase subunit A
MDISSLTITELASKLATGEVKVADAVAAYRANIAARNTELNVYLEEFATDAAVAAAQARIDAGERDPLLGIPFAIKDNILIEGQHSSASSRALEGYVAPYSSTAAAKIIAAGAICLGRVNMDEFAMGGSTENSAFGVTRNPVAPSRVSGGSSGGSAAAVAANMACFALGSDTGGSIRQPASFCGAVGLKPTYGAVSRHGLIAMSSSLDVIGPITRTVEDANIVLDVLAGVDAMDATTAAFPTENLPRTKRIGVPRSLLAKGVDADVLANFEASLAHLAQAGYEIVDVNLDKLSYSLAAYYVIMPAEVSSNMARFDGLRFGEKVEGATLLGDYLATRGQLLGAEVRRRIILGTYVLSSGYYDAYYGKARALRDSLRKEVLAVLDTCDVIATPTSPVPAFEVGEKSGDPLSMYLADIFTVGANLVGAPAISIPSGTTARTDSKGVSAELPLGLHLMARPFGEQVLFDIGQAFETMKADGRR